MAKNINDGIITYLVEYGFIESTPESSAPENWIQYPSDESNSNPKKIDFIKNNNIDSIYLYVEGIKYSINESNIYHSFKSGISASDVQEFLTYKPINVVIIPKEDSNLDLRREINDTENGINWQLKYDSQEGFLGSNDYINLTDHTVLLKSYIPNSIVVKKLNSTYYYNIGDNYYYEDNIFKSPDSAPDLSSAIEQILVIGNPNDAVLGVTSKLKGYIGNSKAYKDNISVYKSFNAKESFSDAFALEVENDTPYSENSTDYYLKFEAINCPVTIKFSADGVNNYNEFEEECIIPSLKSFGTSSIIFESYGGYFEDIASIPSSVKYGKKLVLPTPKRNIEVYIDESNNDNKTFYIFSFVGWSINSEKNENNKIIPYKLDSVSQSFFWNKSNSLEIYPIWAVIEGKKSGLSVILDSSNNNYYKITKSPNRTIYSSSLVALSKEDDGSKTNFSPLDWNDENFKSILRGLELTLNYTGNAISSDTYDVSNYTYNSIIKFDEVSKNEFNIADPVKAIAAEAIQIFVSSDTYRTNLIENNTNYLTFLKDNSGNYYIPITSFGYNFSQIISVKTSVDSDDVSTLMIDDYPVHNSEDDWKVSLDIKRQVTDASLISLFDLLGYEVKTSNGSRYSLYINKSGSSLDFSDASSKRKGTKLNHDIILNNTQIYNDSYGVYNSDDVASLWKQNGIDIGLAVPDPRNTPHIEEFNSSVSLFSETDGNSGKGEIKFYKKSAYIKPEKVTDIYFIDPSVRTLASWFLFEKRTANSKFFPTGSELDKAGWFSEFTNEMYSVQEYLEDEAGNNTSSIDQGSAIILSSPDSILKTTLNFSGDLNCWTRICLNPYNGKVVRLILAAILSHSNNLKLNSSFTILNNLGDFQVPEGSNIVTKEISSVPLSITSGVVYNNTVDGSFTTESISDEIKNLFETNASFIEILKNTFVWIRASFAADYINYKDFDQCLNKDSSVIHKNLLLRNSTSNADFNRYKGKLSNSSTTFPYIPKNAPLKDYITETLLEKEGINNASELKRISRTEDTIIGSVLSDSKNIESTQMMSPLNFYDPDAEYFQNNYRGNTPADGEFKMPTIIPKEGNLHSDSRVISPSIDELWYIIKKLISGREIDTNIESGNVSVNSAKFYGSGLRENDKDQTLKELEKNFRFFYKNKNGTREGDPVDFKYELVPDEEGYTDLAKGTISEITVEEFFTQPNNVRYNIYNYDDGNTITSRKEELDQDSVHTIYEESLNIGGSGAKSKYFNVSSNASPNSSNWLPRPAPLSLRELEAGILGNKFNIINNFKFVKDNFVKNGFISYSDSDENASHKNVGGGLYQLHKNYDYSSEYSENQTPNTALTRNDSDSKPINTLTYETGSEENNLNIYKNQTGNFSDTENETKGDSPIPLLVKNYSLSSALENNRFDYDSKRVYLNAEGEWTLENQYIRLPILRSKY